MESVFSTRVLEATGKNITSFGPLGALSISIVTGSLLIFDSLNGGIPVALTQINIGAILGVGVYKDGFKNTFKKNSIKRIFIVWFIAPIIAFIVAYTMTNIYL